VESLETRLIGTYLALVPLARGGMGEVWIAVSLAETDPRRLCLVKTVKSNLAGDSETQRRFVDEAQIALRLRGEHLCHVFDAGGVDDELFLAMELIEGLTFKRVVDLLHERGGWLDEEVAVALAVGMLRGLHEAHTAVDPASRRALGVVHRDVSPHNVMVDHQGQVKIIDFGLATSIVKQTMTESAVVLGKTAYMAPEQARGDDTTAATDQFAAAIVLYELLTGDRFYGDMPSRAIWSVVSAGRHRPRSMERIVGRLQAALSRALSPAPGKRFASCAAFADALCAAVPGAESAATRQRLAALVASLADSEQKTVAEARARAALVLPAANANLEEATRSMTLRVGAHTPLALRTADEPATARTARIVRAKSAPTVGRRSLAIAAAMLLGVVAAVGVVLLLVRPTPATSVASTAALPALPAAVVASPAAPSAPPPAASTAATTAMPPTPTPPPPPTPTTKTPTTKTSTPKGAVTQPSAEPGAATLSSLRAAYRSLRARCSKPCVAFGQSQLDRPGDVRAKQALFDRCATTCGGPP
jgi:serine/threonine-protein kinase